MYNLINFSNSTGEFVPLAQLVQEGGSGTENCTFTLNTQKNQLSFILPAPSMPIARPRRMVYYRAE